MTAHRGTAQRALHAVLGKLLPGHPGRIHASTFTHADRYQRITGRLAAPLYARVAADVAAAVRSGALPRDGRVLDAGTGPGLVLLRIAAACPHLRLDGIDLAPEMIEAARRNAVAAPAAGTGPITFAVADVTRLPFPDATFDLVVSTFSQHHWADPAAGLGELVRVLRPGTQAWIYDFRPALPRAGQAATGLPAGVELERQDRLPGSRWFNPAGRLVLRVPPEPGS